MADDISRFTAIASRYEVLTKVEERELLAKAKADPPDLHAWEKLIRHNLKLVISIAKKYIGQGVTFEDLIQEGLIGLVKAIEKFDLDKKVRRQTISSKYLCYMVDKASYYQIY